MNPFESNENNTTNIFSMNEVIITTEKAQEKGKRTLTKIYGLEFDNETMKTHLSAIKKKIGCNGSLKKEDEKTVIWLQGESNINRIEDYLKEVGVKNIKINMS